MTVTQDGAVIDTIGPVDVPAGASYPFAVNAAAPDREGKTLFAAAAADLAVELPVPVGLPWISAAATTPPVVSSDPFSVTVALNNTGVVDGRVDVSIGGEVTSADVPAGASVLVQGSAQMCSSGELPIPVAGDLAETVLAPVTFGHEISAAVAPLPVYGPGQVEIPYTVENSGLLEGAFTTVVTATDALGQAAVYRAASFLAAGAQSTGDAHFDLPAGDYRLSYAVRAGGCTLSAGQSDLRVAPGMSLALRATAGIPQATAPVTVVVDNLGSAPFDGALRLRTDDGYEVTQPALVAAGGTSTATFDVDVAVAAAGAHTATVSAVTADGVEVEQTSVSYTVQGPDLRVTAVPTRTVLPAGKVFTSTFAVANVGDQSAQAALVFAWGDIVDDRQLRSIAAGEEVAFDFPFYIPPELETREYLATYALNERRDVLPLTVQGISLTVAANTP